MNSDDPKPHPGTPAHAARILAEVRTSLKLEWIPAPVEAYTVKDRPPMQYAHEAEAAVIVHVPRVGWMLVGEVRDNEDLDGRPYVELDGGVFPTLEAAQAEALWHVTYNAACETAEAEGAYDAMEDLLEGRTGGNVIQLAKARKNGQGTK